MVRARANLHPSLALVELCFLLLVHFVHQLDSGIGKRVRLSPE